MEYTNSPLASFTQLSPNHSGKRTHSIDRITPHCYVGQVSVERMGKGWANEGNVSANYGIGSDGRIGLYVEEKNRAWTSSSRDNDQRAITIECASDSKHPYAFNDKVYASLANLCVDICKRNGKTKLLWLGDKTKALNYKLKSNEMVLTVHRWFATKECPGDWLYSRLGELAVEVTKRLGGSTSIEQESKENANNDDAIYHVQIGSFNDKASADVMVEKLKSAGFNAVVKQEKYDLLADDFKVGNKVIIKKDAPRYGGTSPFSPWVYNATLYVREINGSRIVVSTMESGAITGAVDKKYLTKV